MAKQQSTPKPKTYDADTGYKYPKVTPNFRQERTSEIKPLSNGNPGVKEAVSSHPALGKLQKDFSDTIRTYNKK